MRNVTSTPQRFRRCAVVCALVILAGAALSPGVLRAQNATVGNQIMGELAFAAKTKPEKTAGVWVDGQYVGYVNELKGNKKVLLLPGTHEISLRQTGYLESTEKIVTEPGKKTILTVTLEKNPQAQFSAVTAQIKLDVMPDRAAVFVDDHFAGTVNQFRGAGRAMLVAPGNHHIRIALVGYQPFETDVTLLAKQKITIKTVLAPGTVQQAGPKVNDN
ncbi:MAG: PEGA domain-containing protein [Candidatus Acidiferrales bacterium]